MLSIAGGWFSGNKTLNQSFGANSKKKNFNAKFCFNFFLFLPFDQHFEWTTPKRWSKYTADNSSRGLVTALRAVVKTSLVVYLAVIEQHFAVIDLHLAVIEQQDLVITTGLYLGSVLIGR